MSERFRERSAEDAKSDAVEAAVDDALQKTRTKHRESRFLDRVGRRFPKIAGIIAALGVMGSGAVEEAHANPRSQRAEKSEKMVVDSHYDELLNMNRAPKLTKGALYGGVSVAVREALAQKYAHDTGEKDPRSIVSGRLVDMLDKLVVFHQRTAKHEMGLDEGDAAKIDEATLYEFTAAKTAGGKETALGFEMKLGKTDPRKEQRSADTERAILVAVSEKIGDFVGERVSQASQEVAPDKIALVTDKIRSAEVDSKTRSHGKDKITIEGLSSRESLKFSVEERPDGFYLKMSRVDSESVAASKNKKQPGA